MTKYQQVLLSILSGLLVSISGAEEFAQSALKIQLSDNEVRVGSATLCSWSEYEETLAVEPRSTKLQIEAAPDLATAFVVRAIGIARELGFTGIGFSTTDSGGGWSLFPPINEKPELGGCFGSTGSASNES